jgi:hypothetical protein
MVRIVIRRRRAVSHVLSALLLVILSIVAAAFGVSMMSQQARNFTQITSVDASQSRFYVNPTTGEGALTLVFTNTGTTTITLHNGRIGQQSLANMTFTSPVQIKYKNAAGTIVTVQASSVTTSDTRSGVTSQGLVLTSQTSTTIQFTALAGISAAIPSNSEYAVAIYTTGAEVFTFKIVAETSGA